MDTHFGLLSFHDTADIVEGTSKSGMKDSSWLQSSFALVGHENLPDWIIGIGVNRVIGTLYYVCFVPMTSDS